jgi:hypothetical protein
MFKDYRIEVDVPMQKRIAEIICREIKSSLMDNVKNYDLMKKCENQTNQVTVWEEKNKECNEPWEGAADYFIPLTEWIVDAVHSRVMYILFSQEPYMTARGVEAADVDKAPAVTDFVDMVSKEIIELRQNIQFFFKQMIKLPKAVLKYEWEHKIEPLMVKEQAQVFVNQETQLEDYLLPDEPDAQKKLEELLANGFVDSGTAKEVLVKTDKELYNAPRLKYIRAEDYVYSTTVKRGEKAYWEGDRVWFTWNDISIKSQQDIFFKDGVEKVYGFVNSFVGDATGSSKDIAQRKALFECFHWHGRLPFDNTGKINFEDKEAIEQEVHALVAYKEGNKDIEELLYLAHWEYERIPDKERVYICSEFEETENWLGRSLPMKLRKTQGLLNNFYNNLINNAYLAMMKMLWKKRTLVGDDTDEMEIYPGKIIEIDNPGDLGVLELGDVKAMSLGIEKDLLGFAEKISNVSDWNLGQRNVEGGKPTATEFSGVMKEGNIGLDKFIQNCHEVLRKVCKWTVGYYYERMPEGLERRIMGDNGQPLFPTEKNIPLFKKKQIDPYWSKEAIAGQFDFSWNGTSLNSDKERNIVIANDLMDRYLKMPMVGGNMLFTWDILRRGLIARGIKDWQTILPRKEDIVKEMQRMANEERLRQAKAKLTAGVDQPGGQVVSV